MRKQPDPPADYPLSHPVCVFLRPYRRPWGCGWTGGRVPKRWLWLDGRARLFMSAAHPANRIRTSGRAADHSPPPTPSLPPPPPPSYFHHCVVFLPGVLSTWMMKEGDAESSGEAIDIYVSIFFVFEQIIICNLTRHDGSNVSFCICLLCPI